jgi:hypothetical protein
MAEVAHILGGYFFHGSGYALILTKYVLGDNLGDIFHKLVWSL